MVAIKLTVGDGTIIRNPTSEQIAEILQDLPGGRDSFVVLKTSPQFFAQCAGNKDEGFLIEYSEDQMTYREVYESCTLEEATDALQRYALADPLWGDKLEWMPFEYEALDSPEDSGLSPMKREKVVEYHARTLIIGRSWILKGLALLIAILTIYLLA